MKNKIDKKKMYAFSKKYINATNIKIVILFIPLVVLLINGFIKGTYSFESFLDVSIIVSFIVVGVCEILANAISKAISKRCEDAVKLGEDYKSLCNLYSRENLLKYQKATIPVVTLAHRKLSDPAFVLDIKKDENKPRYTLPSQVASHSAELMEAHKESTVYNNINVRLNDCKQNDSTVSLLYSQTTYFDSLITNRAMDYSIAGKTIRDIYEPGPFLSPLSESKFSNHLGFNGFVELKDGKIIFVYRNNKVSIGKNTWATSIGASFKAKYGLNDNKEMTIETISNAIRGEIRDELKIDLPENMHLEDTIFAFYRDVVEGGKPQFLFYLKYHDISFEEFKENFANKLKEKGAKEKDRKKVLTDGEKFTCFTLEELKQFTFSDDGMTSPQGKKYNMVPSSVGSVVLLLKAFSE